MKKIFAFLLVFTFAVSFASAWDIDGGLAGATAYKIDMGLKNQIREAYDNNISVELVLPVHDVVKVGILVKIDNTATNLDYNAASRTQTIKWSEIADEFKFGVGVKPNEDIQLGMDFYFGVSYSDPSGDIRYDAYERIWDRDQRTFTSNTYGNGYFGFDLAVGISNKTPLDTIWIIQKIKVTVGEGFGLGIASLPNFAKNTGGDFRRDEFRWTSFDYDGTIKTGIPIHTLKSLDIGKLAVSLEYNYGLLGTTYVTGYVKGANDLATSLYSNQVYGDWNGGRKGFTALPMGFSTNHDFKVNLGINYSNIETNVWVKPEITYDLVSWKWNGVKPYQKDTVSMNFYIGADWKISIPAQTFFPCVVSFKLGADWKIANSWAMTSDAVTNTSKDGTGGTIVNSIAQSVKGTFEMEMDFNGVTATLGWSPDVYFGGSSASDYATTSGGSNTSSGSSVSNIDTNLFNLANWKIGVSIEFDPPTKKTSAVDDEDDVEADE